MSRFLYRGVLAALAYVFLLDGYVRLSTGNADLTLLRDVVPSVLVLVGLAGLATTPHRIPRPPMVGFVCLFIGLVLVQIANPYAISPEEALAATRQHLEFVPLFFLGFAVMNTVDRLRGVALLIVIAGALNGVVGLAQANLTSEQLANWGPGYARLVTTQTTPAGEKRGARVYVTESGEERLRPPALGGDLGFGGVMGALALPLGLALALGAGRRSDQTLGLVTLPLSLAAVLTSQTRTAVLVAVVAVAAFLTIGAAGRRGGAIVARSVVASACAVLAFSFAFRGSLDLSRLSSIAPSRLLDTFTGERGGSVALLPDYVWQYPLGAGLGSVGPAAGARQASVHAGELSGENLFVFMVVELGVAGLLVVLAMFVAVLRCGVSASRDAPDRKTQLLLSALTAGLGACAVLSLGGAITAAPPTAPFFWLGVGTLARWTHVERPAAVAGLSRRGPALASAAATGRRVTAGAP
jgi:hypothetical protein